MMTTKTLEYIISVYAYADKSYAAALHAYTHMLDKHITKVSVQFISTKYETLRQE